jgi:hypothetical protein
MRKRGILYKKERTGTETAGEPYEKLALKLAVLST